MVKGIRGRVVDTRWLARQMTSILLILLLAVDEPLDATKCGGEGNCQNDKAC